MCGNLTILSWILLKGPAGGVPVRKACAGGWMGVGWCWGLGDEGMTGYYRVKNREPCDLWVWGREGQPWMGWSAVGFSG